MYGADCPIEETIPVDDSFNTWNEKIPLTGTPEQLAQAKKEMKEIFEKERERQDKIIARGLQKSAFVREDDAEDQC